jgi:dTDP-4-amino-4,6-dideoxygalactose transaminase
LKGKNRAKTHRAGEAVDATVVGAGTAAVSIVIRAAGSIGESAKIIIKGMVFLHHDDDVVDF